MRVSRRIGCLLAAAALSLTACGGGSPHAARVPPPTSTPTSKPITGSSTPTTVSSTTALRTVAAAPASAPVNPVTSTSINVAARTQAGEQVDVPTRIWYPSTGGGEREPLVVFSPGYQIDPSRYDVLTAAWAAAGYVVAEPQYPDTALGSPPIEDDIVNHPAELRQVITTVLSDARTAGLVAANEIAVVGQSDGGDVSLATAYNTCCRDPRIRAAIILSGAEWTIFGGAYYTAHGPPMLVVQGDEDTINVPACSGQLFNSAPGTRFYFDIADGTHLSPYTGPVGPEVTAVRQVTISFLDGYLKGVTSETEELDHLDDAAKVGHVVEGPATVPVHGTCPGAPVPGGA